MPMSSAAAAEELLACRRQVMQTAASAPGHLQTTDDSLTNAADDLLAAPSLPVGPEMQALRTLGECPRDEFQAALDSIF